MILYVDSSTSVELPGFQFALEQEDERWVNMGRTANGAIKSFDRQVMSYWIRGTVKLSEAELNSLKSFLKTDIAYGNSACSLIPETNVDLGSGAGNPIEVRYWNKSLKYSRYAPSRYDTGLQFIRTATA